MMGTGMSSGELTEWARGPGLAKRYMIRGSSWKISVNSGGFETRGLAGSSTFQFALLERLLMGFVTMFDR